MLSLYIPKLEDYWYEEKILSDKETMSYNAGWETLYEGYNYETGCISFPKAKWSEKYSIRQDSSHFFYYIKLNENFIGFCNFQLNNRLNKWECGIIIENKYRRLGYGKRALSLLCQEAFKHDDIHSLFDTFEETRNSAKIFYDIVFKKIKDFTSTRFNKEINMIEVCLNRKDFR